MALICPQCSHENPDRSTFCVRCGNRLQSTGQIGQVPSQPNIPSSFSYSAVSDPPPYTPPSQIPPYSPPPTAPSSVLPAPPPVVGSWATAAPASTSSYSTQMGTGQGTASIRRAFAGHGTLIMHHSWLLNGQHTQTKAVREAIIQKVQQRGTVGLKITPEKLMESGLLMEERDYVTVSRGVSTVFVYVAPAGQDLYVSRATTVLPAIDSFRAVLLGLVVFVTLFGPPIVNGILSSPTSTYPYTSYNPLAPVLSGLISALTFPLWIFLIWLLIRSCIYWAVENDFWHYLRRRTINDFQIDDIALMEHITDDVVRDAAQELGLDGSKITPPTEGYRPKRTIRAL